jgi:hypothetical protein
MGNVPKRKNVLHRIYVESNRERLRSLIAKVYDTLPFQILPRKQAVLDQIIAYRACRFALHGKGRDLHIPSDAPLTKIRQLNPIQSSGKPDWFAFYHCGPLGLANRSRELQMQDWEQLGEWLRLRG